MKKTWAFAALVVCYIIWGLQPLYWMLLDDYSPLFILCCRIAASALFTWLYLIARGRIKEIIGTLKNWAVMKYLLPAAIVLGLDFALFIFAVAGGRVLDATLGYYMNPLFIFVSGVLIFRERGHLLEYVAVGLALVGVILGTVQFGSFPALSLCCAVLWPTYASIKKAVNADPVVSIAVETAVLTPAAIVLAFVLCRGFGGFSSVSPAGVGLLLLSGIVTALPMILYTYVVNDLPFKVVGIMQYAGTSITLLCGLLFMNEVMTASKLTMFGFIWLGLIIFTIGSFRRQRAAAHPTGKND